MKAAVTTTWNRIEVLDQSIPAPGPGQVLLRTTLAGVCGSDVHIFHGGHPTARAPVVQGHEFVAIIESFGDPKATSTAAPGNRSLQKGDRVVVEPLVSCGSCEACRRGFVHVCRKLGLLGIHRNGAFAEYLIADVAKVVRIPDELDDRSAVLAEPFAVGVHVCSRAGLGVGTRALVIGAGPIGLIVAMVARASGVEVTLAEVSPARIEQARSLGFAVIDSKPTASTATDTASAESVGMALEATNGDGFDGVFEVSGSQAGVSLALSATRVRGQIVQVGFFGKTQPKCDLQQLIMRELTLTGSRVYTYEDFTRTVALLSRIKQSGAIDLRSLVSETCGLNGIESGLERMHRGEVRGKILVDPTILN